LFNREVNGMSLAMSDEIERWRREAQTLETRLAEQTRSFEEMVQRLKRRESRLSAYFNQGLVGMCVTSTEKGWVEVNDRLVAMFGYSREEFLKRTWAELTHPDDLEADVTRFESMARGEIEGYEMEKRYLRKDGSVLHSFLAVGCDRDADRRLTEVFAVIVDLTEVKRAEEARDIAHRRVREILDSSEAAMLALDSSGVITECNRRAVELFGWPREEMLGQGAAELVIGRAAFLTFRRHFALAVQESRGQEGGVLGDTASSDTVSGAAAPANPSGSRPTQLAGRHRGGREFPVALKVMPLPSQGEPEFTLSILDLSERMRAEEELRTYTNRLKQSNADLEQFAYVASHDLQEPLRAVTGFCQLLELDYGHRLDEEGQGYIAKAVAGTERMRRLISDLLDYSRVTRHGVEFEPHDLTRVAMEARDLWERRLREAGGAIDIDPLPTLRIDRGQMVRVFQNLFSNAIKYRGAAPPQIRVSVAERAEDWQITVRDNGIGIAPEFHQRIFVIFQRLHTRTEHEGTGIGLAICHRIVQRHGGQIWVESEAGEGSGFHFTVPKGL